MSKAELVFIPSPSPSHLVANVEAAKILLHRDPGISVTILIMKILNDDNPTGVSSSLSSPRLTLIDLTNVDSKSSYFDHIDSQADNIRQILSNLIQNGSNLVGLVLGMFCTNLIRVADEFSLPSYVLFTSGACCLGLFYDLMALKFDHNEDLTRYKNSDAELPIRCFSKPVPAKVLPNVFVDGDGSFGSRMLECFRTVFEAKGIMVNTFYELEPYALQSLMSYQNSPKIYPVGPILNPNKDESRSASVKEAMKWLDDQRENSVVFLCFGSMGSFEEVQVREIAEALEGSGVRFLWSLRKKVEGMLRLPVEHDSLDEVLPEGFLDRTREMGRVIGWAPQVAVLQHAAVAAFVSHCGWNSTLESVWYGVPVAAWPLYAEQQINAFELVRELGIAEEVRIDYRREFKGEEAPEVVPWGEIEMAIRRVMAAEGVRVKVGELQRKSREALEEGGSSYTAQVNFVEDVLRNVGLDPVGG